ncbi:MAG: hypothetical protein JNG85_17860 [Spirochaetaceae bacterium]|nr:hypothetical protein [Spirochaetaceae bacterium]
MKKILFFLGYFSTPVVPIVLYQASLGWPGGAYSASVALGVAAFVFLANQFVLASRPRFAVETLGLKALLKFHGTMPVVALALAAAHRVLKIGVSPALGDGLLGRGLGFSEDTLQASFGGAGFWVFAGLVVFTALLMANTFWMKLGALKKAKDWVYAKTGLDYRRARLLHNAAIVGGLVILVHALLASSSAFGANPFGAAWLAVWLLGSLALYARYKLKGAAAKPGARAATE